jgi:hypothetical protein
MLMRILFVCVFSLFLILAFSVQSFAQQTQAAPAASVTSASPVPRLIKFSGILLDQQGQPLKGPVGVTFSLYAQQSGDSALWMETQNVELDAKGVYAVLLGANTAAGLPEEMFRSGEARWLGIQPEREPEQPRVLLVSAPYALKAADADTLGGLPASAFVLAGSPTIRDERKIGERNRCERDKRKQFERSTSCWYNSGDDGRWNREPAGQV